MIKWLWSFYIGIEEYEQIDVCVCVVLDRNWYGCDDRKGKITAQNYDATD